ncbi:MAG: hypothetical protein DWQ31_03495 [Planctomycetota bacterium]|nr:MAG: hypothetical protein DWQ31_03495 [Planctomycetota bacterium]REJ90902.1 MAG: hypothetical protein DWQ35_15570 [Planctomycetota bacterium]REK17679.1 MAG: hypothetical protein DWQ42_21785 [Planctomycetota bacterium]REK46732.1 MAG: hypothetical protein DWQ46_05895 [Planctomycetota bacterium]
MPKAPIVVDFRHLRCGRCKVALIDALAGVCPICGAEFDGILSNHIGLAEQLHERRNGAGVRQVSSDRLDTAADRSFSKP